MRELKPLTAEEVDSMDTSGRRLLCADWRRMRAALEMVRDADDNCKRDGLPTMPKAARAKIDAALGDR